MEKQIFEGKNRIFINGMENDISSGAIPTKKKGVIMYFYYLALILISPRKKYISNIMIFIDGENGDKYFDTSNINNNIYHGRYLNSLKRIIHLPTCMHPFSRLQRIKLFIIACKEHKKFKISYPLGYFIDFNYIYNFIKKSNITQIFSSEQRDRYITWLSEIAKEVLANLTISPHGTLIGISNPLEHKINVNKIYVWNDIEEQMYKNYIVRNENCIYEKTEYSVSVKFKQYNKKNDDFLIGIYSQNNRETNISLARHIVEQIQNVKVFIFLHPLEQNDKLYNSINNNRIIIERSEKIINLDCVVTGNSTIIYDLLYSKYNKEILCFTKKNEYAMVSNLVSFYDSEDAIIDKIKDIV